MHSPAADATPTTTAEVNALAGRCVALSHQGGPLGTGSGPFRVRAAGLGRFLFYGTDARLLSAGPRGSVAVEPRPTSRSIWAATGSAAGITLRSGAVELHGVQSRAATGCRNFPDAELDVDGAPFTGVDGDGNLRGFVDSHAHLMSEQFLGGEFHCGAPYSPLGVTVALRDCPDHGRDGVLAVGEQVLSRPGPHDTVGWPTFRDWPRWDSLTHEQTYYRWIERAWRSGLRMIDNYYVQNRVLCENYPLRDQPCDEMESIRIQHRMLLGLRDYIDAQAGGPGRGFLRIVTTAAQARRVVAAGKLAVTLGIEVAEPFGCREGAPGRPAACDRAAIDRGLDELRALGIRQVILTHKFDNALGGTRFDQGATGVAVNAGQQLSTGHPWVTQPCPTDQHDNPVVGYPRNACNVRGLTALGEYTVRAIIARRMIVDVDHLSVKSATRVLDIIAAHHYPGVVSSHSWTDKTNYRRILTAGGAVGLFATPAEAEPGEVGRHGDLPPDFLSAWRILRAQRDPRFYFGVGFGPDMGGLGKQAHPRPSATRTPVVYPFLAADGRTRIWRQVTGRRVFDVNRDGTAHYGLLPDWIESLRVQAGADGPRLVGDLFAAAEAYVRMWERVEGSR
ncbi:sphingolipid ceramide N-deacylase [Gordonia sp. ABSL1-1]|uniref:sphingolipid ceramide N-deacylase n=1 Tax=Gordonia sp. ABSL1-1 TaxID=3053923 RepID=UPI0025735925|nr:sphingolipid ceramide N-deacylase [Gordonia sp. ABSL1-1]MDL9935716.1 sphingolipid ceramide N-deacylase [Gordonia sp. ABSL1-1]